MGFGGGRESFIASLFQGRGTRTRHDINIFGARPLLSISTRAILARWVRRLEMALSSSALLGPFREPLKSVASDQALAWQWELRLGRRGGTQSKTASFIACTIIPQHIGLWQARRRVGKSRRKSGQKLSGSHAKPRQGWNASKGPVRPAQGPPRYKGSPSPRHRPALRPGSDFFLLERLLSWRLRRSGDRLP